MRVTLLGTGSADGWPNPFCRCASCETARGAGEVRAQTSALVDGRLLLDCGPETLRQAERAGHPLDDVAAVLVTRLDRAGLDPAFLRYRRWVTDRPLRVLGLPSVAEACQPWLRPGSPVSVQALAPHERVEVAGYRVRALGARGEGEGGGLLYDVTAPDGSRLLYAPGTGPLGEADVAEVAAGGPAYSTLLLEETFGDRAAHGDDHLDFATFAHVLAGLRRAGAVDDRTDVVAVHLSHHNPPAPALAARLDRLGARLVPDGTTLGTAAGTAPLERRAPVPRRTLLTGGARSGKSREAERILLAEPDVVYVATSVGAQDDPAWQRRVQAHRERRPRHWRTVETLQLAPLLAEPGPPLLVDCLTLWLAGVLDRLDAWTEGPGADGRVEREVAAELDALVQAWRGARRRVVAVTNEVGSGVVPGTASGGRFRDLLGRLNAEVAAESDEVLLCVAGRVVRL